MARCSGAYNDSRTDILLYHAEGHRRHRRCALRAGVRASDGGFGDFYVCWYLFGSQYHVINRSHCYYTRHSWRDIRSARAWCRVCGATPKRHYCGTWWRSRRGFCRRAPIFASYCSELPDRWLRVAATRAPWYTATASAKAFHCLVERRCFVITVDSRRAGRASSNSRPLFIDRSVAIAGDGRRAIRTHEGRQTRSGVSCCSGKHGRTSVLCDFRDGNPEADTVAGVYRELRRRGREAQRALLPLVDDEEEGVRVWAAAHALEFALGVGEPALTLLSQGVGPAAFTATVTLCQWRKGELSFP